MVYLWFNDIRKSTRYFSVEYLISQSASSTQDFTQAVKMHVSYLVCTMVQKVSSRGKAVRPQMWVLL